jgi:CheY-like chemotaxis protein
MPARILVADDNPIVRTTLRMLLEGIGHSGIIEAENGRDAVSKTLELRPDLVILDFAMPVLDGLNAAREISQHLPKTPLLMYSMHWSKHVEIEAQKLGVRKVISKANSSLLLATVQQLLGETAPPPAVNSPEAAPHQIQSPRELHANLVLDPAVSLSPASLAAEPSPNASQPEVAKASEELPHPTISDPPTNSN